MNKRTNELYLFILSPAVTVFSCGLGYMNRTTTTKKSQTLGVTCLQSSGVFFPTFLRICFEFVSILKQVPHKNINSWFQESSGGAADALIMDLVTERWWKYCAC